MSRKEQLLQGQVPPPPKEVVWQGGSGVWGWVIGSEGEGRGSLSRPFIVEYICFVYSKSNERERERERERGRLASWKREGELPGSPQVSDSPAGAH